MAPNETLTACIQLGADTLGRHQVVPFTVGCNTTGSIALFQMDQSEPKQSYKHTKPKVIQKQKTTAKTKKERTSANRGLLHQKQNKGIKLKPQGKRGKNKKGDMGKLQGARGALCKRTLRNVAVAQGYAYSRGV